MKSKTKTKKGQMKVDIITIFPEMFESWLGVSLVKRAQTKGILEIKVHNLRDWTKDSHKTVDDRPFGGGVGMILKPEPIFKAVEQLYGYSILMSPQGKVFDQNLAKKFSKKDHLIFVCPHYEGIDERVREHLVDEEISIGDYILTGGELPAMVVIDAVTRLIPGFLGKRESKKEESFNLKIRHKPYKISYLLEYPQYTRPADFKGMKVPKVLLSGNHQEIKKWRQKQAFKRTKKRRPDLLKNDV